MRVARHSLFPTTADLAHAVLPTLGLEMEHNIQKLVPRQGAVVAPINATGSVPIKSFDLNKAWPGYFNYTEWPTVADGNDMVEGSCPASVMSDECQEDLRAVIRARPGIANNNGEPLFHTPNVLENVTSCQGYTTATARRKHHLSSLFRSSCILPSAYIPLLGHVRRKTCPNLKPPSTNIIDASM